MFRSQIRAVRPALAALYPRATKGLAYFMGERVQSFDPRRRTYRLTPRLMLGVAGLAALAVGLRLAATPHAHPAAGAPAPLNHAELAALETEAFAQSAAQPGFAAPVDIPVKIQRGETFEAAVRRVGVAPNEARQVVDALGKAFDTVNIKAGMAFNAAVALPRDHRGPVRLVGLSMRAGPASAITLSRTFDGGLRLRELEEKIRDDTTVAQGSLRGSLYESAEAAGVTSSLTAQVVKLFSHKLDFSRDIHAGDEFRLVFDRKVTESGRTIETGDLLYAEIGAKGQVTQFYRFQPSGGEAQYFDALGKNIKGFLLRTPVDGARVTSGFGMRMHPLLGYTRMHQGIDFGVPTGTPVFAAGDGVVEEARWAGGYGRWMKLRHTGGWETAYGHLSGWAVRPGAHVHQGQVIAYSGSTGESTGPHLHYEVIKGGTKINPKGANAPGGTVLEGRQLAAFKSEKAHIDNLLSGASSGVARLAKADFPRTDGGPYGRPD